MDKDILIIDDDISILDGFKELLMQEGYRVEGALNEEEALMSLKQKPCRLVITDLILQETTGLDLAKKIKEISADTDIILITAYPTMESAIGSLRAGICDYLVKPVKKAELLSAIQKREQKRKIQPPPLPAPAAQPFLNEDRTSKAMLLEQAAQHIYTINEEIIKHNQLLFKTLINGKQLQYCQSISMDHFLLDNLANNILDIARLDAGEIHLSEDDFEFSAVMQNIAKSIYPAIRHKPIQFFYEIDPQIPHYLNCDYNRLRQILINLLSNALKFTLEGEIRLKARLMTTIGKGCHVFFVVRDTGRGIAKDRQMDIFKTVFFKEAAHEDKRVGGLGLWLSKLLVEKMGGLISVHSEPVLGSEFRFSVRFNLVDGDSK